MIDALTAIRQLAEERETFTPDDVHDLVGDPPEFNQMGKVFQEAVKLEICQETGEFVRSRRKAAKGRKVQKWTRAEPRQPALI